MKVLKFDLFGKTAHFKNPEYNMEIEVTFDQITKTHLLGILGAIIGLKGRQQQRKLGKIEWWEELKGARVSIVPHSSKWRKYIDTTNNSTGFANKGGSTQVLRRQYLEEPRWTIYVSDVNIKENIWDKLTRNLKQGSSEYPLYLGQTNNPARIDNVIIVDLEEVDVEEVEYCNSLFKVNKMEVIEEETEEGILYISKQIYPIGLNNLGLYRKEWLMHTNSYLSFKEGNFYSDGKLVLSFI